MFSPLIQRLLDQHGYPTVGTNTLEAFLDTHDTVALFFTEDPVRFPEANDVAVVLPELVKTFGFTPAVVERDSEKALQSQYGFVVWPALVFLRRGRHLGTLTRIRDWSEYMNEIPKLLNAESAATDKIHQED